MIQTLNRRLTTKNEGEFVKPTWHFHLLQSFYSILSTVSTSVQFYSTPHCIYFSLSALYYALHLVQSFYSILRTASTSVQFYSTPHSVYFSPILLYSALHLLQSNSTLLRTASTSVQFYFSPSPLLLTPPVPVLMLYHIQILFKYY